MAETPRQYYNKRLAALKQERDSWVPHWQELAQYFYPRRGRFMLGQANKGDKRNQKLIDGTPRFAARTLSSGMCAGLTSPARPWLKLAVADSDLMDFTPVKVWLSELSRDMLDLLAKSNFYAAAPLFYGEMGVFGTASMAMLEDAKETVRFHPFTIGTYCIAQNAQWRPDTFAREFQMTVRQLVQQFGLSKVSPQVKAAYDNDQLEQWINVVHMVHPNADRNPAKVDSKNLPVRSCYYEDGNGNDLFLSEKGFYEDPILTARWETLGEDVYGSSPAMDALGDSKALQLQQRRKAQAIDKHVDPPMNAPSSLKNSGASLLPGDVTYQDVMAGQRGFEPAYVIKPELGEMREDMAEMRERIDTAMYANLFLMLLNDQRSGTTAREIDERHEEKMLMLGPVVERLNDEFLDPMIARLFGIMQRKGLVREPPKELQGVPLKIEYISVLAQAQRALGVGSLERFIGYIAQTSPVHPEMLDKVDFDQSIDEYGQMLGTPAKIIRDDDTVKKIREDRAQQQQAQQALASAEQASKTAQNLGNTPTTGDNALAGIMQSIGAA